MRNGKSVEAIPSSDGEMRACHAPRCNPWHCAGQSRPRIKKPVKSLQTVPAAQRAMGVAYLEAPNGKMTERLCVPEEMSTYFPALPIQLTPGVGTLCHLTLTSKADAVRRDGLSNSKLHY